VNVKWIVELEERERDQLLRLTHGGDTRARRMKRAQVLLLANSGLGDREIAKVLPVGTSTVFRTKKKYVEGGLEYALAEKARVGAERKLRGKDEAMLIAIACSEPPDGRSRWTLTLLAERLVASTDLETISTETVRRHLAESELKPWQKRMWCIPKVDAEFVARMEDVLDLYSAPVDPQRPVVCFDETPVQLVGETRTPRLAEPGKPARFDYEYKRNGVANVFGFFDAGRRWRHAKVTERRTKADFADCMRDLVDVHYPDAERIRVVMDNLNTHRPAALYDSFPPEEARRVLRRMEFHYTPKHGSWLNMVEMEFGIMNKQCLDRRIPNSDTLASELTHWERRRNDDRATINWRFSIEDARAKFARSYPLNQS
jgi:transposase